MATFFELFRRFYSLKQRKGWYFFQSRGANLVTHLSDSHKDWKGKIIKLKSPCGFGMSLEWRLADGSQHRFLKVMEVEVMVFSKVRELSFSKNFVNDELVIRKHWLQPPVASRARGGFSANPATQIGEPSGTGSPPRVSLFSFLSCYLGINCVDYSPYVFVVIQV